TQAVGIGKVDQKREFPVTPRPSSAPLLAILNLPDEAGERHSAPQRPQPCLGSDRIGRATQAASINEIDPEQELSILPPRAADGRRPARSSLGHLRNVQRQDLVFASWTITPAFSRLLKQPDHRFHRPVLQRFAVVEAPSPQVPDLEGAVAAMAKGRRWSLRSLSDKM